MRIRTIKPEFWTSLDMAKVSEPALILAIGLLNYADDKGYFVADPRLIHGALTPLRQLSRPIMDCLKELTEVGFISLCTGTDGRPYGHVVNFLKHQNINRPKASRIASCWSEASLNSGHAEMKPKLSANPVMAASLDTTLFNEDPIPDPTEQPKGHWLMDLWNAHAPSALPRCTTWSKKRQTAAKVRLKEHPDRGQWQQAIESIEDCPFLMGQNDRGWTASIDWLLLRPDSITKILEGQYRCRGRQPALVGSSIAGEGDLSF